MSVQFVVIDFCFVIIHVTCVVISFVCAVIDEHYIVSGECCAVIGLLAGEEIERGGVVLHCAT